VIPWPWVAAVAGLLALAGSSSSSSTSSTSSSPPWVPPSSTPKTPGQVVLEQLLERAGLPLKWRQFFLLVAKAESGFDSLAFNVSVPEAAAAAAAYDRLAAVLEPCGYPREFYAWGSGGYYGQIPAIASVQLGGCHDPNLVFDPVLATAAAVEFAHGLMAYSSFQDSPRWATLRRGWGLPSAMDEPIPEPKRAAWAADAAALGLPPTFLDELVSPLPVDGPTVLARLGGA
jgi:hypothetical protein